MKKKVGILTFHSSYNYGSMLQAYALQQVIIHMGCICNIINFRTSRQREFYKPPFMQGRVWGRIKRMLKYMPYIVPLLKKQSLFEAFMSEKFILTNKEYMTLEDLASGKFDFDYYISGSDQIWNTACFDFDWAYFLPFVNKGKKISYAPSMGSNPEKSFDCKLSSKIETLLSQYSAISVREKGTAFLLKKITNQNYPVMLDPTLLLDSSYWNNIAGDQPLVSYKYIYFYAPWFNEIVFEKAKELAKHLNLKIIVSQVYNDNGNNWIDDNIFIPYLAVGPIEFLNLCKFADFTIGMSFHLAVFSILLHTPFYIINGMNDNRVKDLLELTDLEFCSLAIYNEPNPSIINIDFNKVNQKIDNERERCLSWLKEALENL